MAYAMLKGLSMASDFSVGRLYINDVDPARTNLFVAEFKGEAVESKELVAKADTIILAVKPQQVPDVLAATSDVWNEKKLLVSIAAGIKTGTIESLLAPPVPVIRVMPNTPCLVGAGVSAFCPGRHAKVQDMEIAGRILRTTGIALATEEKNMDAVTAVSGSGPAYIFLVVEAMINAAVQVGLDVNTARQLVLKTMSGSIKMLEETGEHPAVLREQVSSPAGTTIAGIKELEANGLRRAFFDAIEKAWKRSIELGNK